MIIGQPLHLPFTFILHTIFFIKISPIEVGPNGIYVSIFSRLWYSNINKAYKNNNRTKEYNPRRKHHIQLDQSNLIGSYLASICIRCVRILIRQSHLTTYT